MGGSCIATQNDTHDLLPWGEVAAWTGHWEREMTKQLITTWLMMLFTGVASAATLEALLAHRDATAPDRCERVWQLPANGINSRHIGGGSTLYVVPCRSTFADVISMGVIEQDGTLRTLSFPDPGLALGPGWQNARLNRIGVTTLLSSPRWRDDGTLVSSNRMAPGMGDGYIVRHYRFDDGSPVLSRFAIEQPGQTDITLWPQR